MTIGRVMANHAHQLRKSCESLLGICTGIIADDALNEREVRFLDLWLKDNADISTIWPGEVIARRIGEVLADGNVVRFSGKLLRTTNITEEGKMTEPDFLFTFTNIEKIGERAD
ncbi:MAG: hypothetical protein Q7T29_09285 [Gallionella sp.]|nr:hypothetical protein [Gallionella sp.]